MYSSENHDVSTKLVVLFCNNIKSVLLGYAK